MVDNHLDFKADSVMLRCLVSPVARNSTAAGRKGVEQGFVTEGEIFFAGGFAVLGRS